MADNKDKLKMILKFDWGADGFKKMIYVLAISAFLLLLLGVYFLIFYYKGVSPQPI